MDNNVVATYNYKDINGKVVWQKLRLEPKSFIVRHQEDGQWIYNLEGIPPMLYNLPKVVKSNEVFIVEGEKDVHNMVGMGFVATTAPFGAGKWNESFNQYFQEKTVYIIPDNDDVGRKHAEIVASNLVRVAREIKILNLSIEYNELKEKGDISDILSAIGAEKTKELLHHCIEYAPIETITIYTNTEWKEIQPFDTFTLPKFPIESLPKIMKDYVETISENLATPVEMCALAEFAIAAVCLQGKIFVQAKTDYKEPINLYVLIIAEPGERKSPLLKLLSAPLYDFEKKSNEERADKIREEEVEIKSKNKQIEELEANGDFETSAILQKEVEILEKNRTRFMRMTSDDFTIEALTSLMANNNGRMAVISSEGGIFNNITGRYSAKGSFETLLKAYTGDTIRVDRKSRATELIENPSLTILVMAQESVLEGIMDNGNLRGQGLLGRFLYCQPNSPMGTRRYDTPPLNHEIIEEFHNILFELLNIESVNILKFSDEAQQVCKEFFEWIEPQLVKELDTIKDWASKLHGTTLRIAGILHCIENRGIKNGIINKSTMKNARTLAIYFIEHAKKAFSLMGTSEAIIKAKFVLNRLKNINVTEISKRDIYLMCRCKYFKKAEDINESLSLLEEHGYIRIKDKSKSNTVGRKPSTVYEINPVVQNVLNEQKGGTL